MTMAVRIRLTRLGKIDNPKYRIVVMDKKTKRDGRVIEILGTYDPTFNPSRVELKNDRYEYWLSKGAQPSQSVERIVKL